MLRWGLLGGSSLRIVRSSSGTCPAVPVNRKPVSRYSRGMIHRWLTEHLR